MKRLAYSAAMIRNHCRHLLAAVCICFCALGHWQQAGAVEARQMQRGKLLYLQNCVICHQTAGQGTPGTFPPLERSDFIAKDFKKAILAVVQRGSGKLAINGKAYDGLMPPVNLDDAKAATPTTYIRK